MQMVFQDPFGSLDPKWSVARIVEEPLIAFRTAARAERRRQVNEVLDRVGLDPERYADRRPRSLSGGQAQRVAIARALALDPALIIYDEAVSSLDVLIRAQVLNLLERLRAELSLTYLFIAHDLALVKQVSDRVAVMYLGKLVEIGPAESLYREPLHPYTVALLASIPNPDPTAARAPVTNTIHGEPPSPIDPPSGLPLPHALSPRPGCLCRRGAAAAQAGRGSFRRVSLSGFARRAGARARQWQEEHMTLQQPTDTLDIESLFRDGTQLIGGEWVPARSGDTIPVINPATGETLGERTARGPGRRERCRGGRLGCFSRVAGSRVRAGGGSCCSTGLLCVASTPPSSTCSSVSRSAGRSGDRPGRAGRWRGS